MKMPRCSTYSGKCAPSDRQRTPDLTGDPDFDYAAMKSHSKGLMNKIAMHTNRVGYGPRTAYYGYSGYAGDE